MKATPHDVYGDGPESTKVLPKHLYDKRTLTFYGDAWSYEDTMAIIDFLQNADHPYYLLWGCALYPDMTFAYAVLTYDYSLDKSASENREESFKKARDFLNACVERNGPDFYFVLDISDCYEGEELAMKHPR